MTTIDPVIGLAVSIRAGPGVYALLLGSGFSRASSVLTGAEIVNDLIVRLATADDATIDGSAGQWYVEKFGKEPRYDVLLNEVAPRPTERQQILRGYFEANEQERARGVKVPAAAHRAVAQMVADGYVRVIVTTNFDRLLEDALRSGGVQPVVVASGDAASGMAPLAHSRCVVIKVHGDYLDPRIRNTPEELSSYDPALSRLLDQVLDEYGLIVCGWSAEWDGALCSAIERAPNRRYTTYWALRGKTPTDAAARLIAARDAQVIAIDNADEFFGTLLEKVQALEMLDAPHPLAAPVATEQLKNYIETKRVIRISDLFRLTVDGVTEGVREPVPSSTAGDAVLGELQRIDALTETMVALLVTSVLWLPAQQNRVLEQAEERLIAAADEHGTGGLQGNFRLYAALRCLYAVGVAAAYSGNLAALHSVALSAAAIDGQGARNPAITVLAPDNVALGELIQRIPGYTRRKTPFSDYLHASLREPLRVALPEDRAYDEEFDLFEYFLGLMWLATRKSEAVSWTWAPVGRFHWREDITSPRHPATKSARQMGVMKGQWRPYAAGLFVLRDYAGFERMKEEYDVYASTSPFGRI